ncbi:sigma-70 family RNA polymerase sigma factor [Anaeromyxobacter sp. SG17]|uniref:RNA polymerase sigma factor n=1 Tax=Anaeromyxobacter sp. SG17 TaxID=2925405 RepID=UPI0027E0C2F4|nr:sigma-70 family RNA polymerase sigma factor [Anaeromyxobacter sp. SG17]
MFERLAGPSCMSGAERGAHDGPGSFPVAVPRESRQHRAPPMRSATTRGDAAEGRAAELDDSELVRRIRAGDRGAFAALVRRHGGGLLRLARLFTRESSMAEEVVQETWMAVLEGLDGFEERASFKTWLYRILANRARSRAVREGRSVPFSALADAGPEERVDPERFDAAGRWRDPPVGWTDQTPERLALEAETRRVMEVAVAALPATQRAVLVLRDEEGLETEEICNLLGLTVTNQRVLLHRARTRVRQALEAYMRGGRPC